MAARTPTWQYPEPGDWFYLPRTSIFTSISSWVPKPGVLVGTGPVLPYNNPGYIQQWGDGIAAGNISEAYLRIHFNLDYWNRRNENQSAAAAAGPLFDLSQYPPNTGNESYQADVKSKRLMSLAFEYIPIHFTPIQAEYIRGTTRYSDNTMLNLDLYISAYHTTMNYYVVFHVVNARQLLREITQAQFQANQNPTAVGYLPDEIIDNTAFPPGETPLATEQNRQADLQALAAAEDTVSREGWSAEQYIAADGYDTKLQRLSSDFLTKLIYAWEDKIYPLHVIYCSGNQERYETALEEVKNAYTAVRTEIRSKYPGGYSHFAALNSQFKMMRDFTATVERVAASPACTPMNNVVFMASFHQNTVSHQGTQAHQGDGPTSEQLSGLSLGQG